MFLTEAANQPVADARVKIITAQVIVARRRKHLDDTLADLNDRNIKRAAAQVINHHLLRLPVVQPIGKRRAGRLVDNALDI